MSRLTDAATAPSIELGTVHILGSVVLPLTRRESIVCGRGHEFDLTEELIELARDRNGGAGWVALLDDEERQLARWGEVRVRRGPWPRSEPLILPGTAEADQARVIETERAASLPTDQREAAMAEVIAKYGRAENSRTLRSVR